MQHVSLNCAVLTISDSRTLADDTSGDLLVALIEEDQHTIAAREIVTDDVYRIRASLSAWIATQ